MAITVQSNQENSSVLIKVSDQFDYSLHQEFREAYRYQEQSGVIFRVNLEDATYMDSSALGMILLLKEHADKIAGNVVIEKPNDSVKKILSIAKFEHFVTINH